MVGFVDRALRAAGGRAEAERFGRFCCVGGVGFGVDAIVLTASVHLLGTGPITARIPSAALAILTTFELNRRWAFRGAKSGRYLAALAGYAGVQGLGLLCNLAAYSACCLLLPAPLDAPLLGLAAGSAAALALNYAGASRMVFGGAPAS